MSNSTQNTGKKQAKKPGLPPQDNRQKTIDALTELKAKHPDPLYLEEALKGIAADTGFGKRALTKMYEMIPGNKEVVTQESEPAKSVFTEEELAAGKKLSLQPNIYFPHRKTFKLLGYCGKDFLKDSALTSCGKRLLQDSSADISTGSSASGKSKLWETEEKLIPTEYIVSFTSLTENALNYVGSLENKILKLGELPPRKPNEKEDTPQWSYLRQLISDNKLERGVPQKRNDGKGFELKKYVTTGPCVIWATTTRSQQDFIDEVVNRCGWIPSDESEETTKAVNAEQAKRDEMPQRYSPENGRKLCRAWQAYNAGLKSYPVKIPYAHHLIPNPKHLTARRLYPLISNHVQVSTLLHQDTRQTEIEKGKKYLIATVEDYENVYEQLNSSAPKVLDLVTQVALEAFKSVREKLVNKKLTVGDLMKAFAQSQATTRRWRQQYLSAGLLNLCDEKRGKAELVELGATAPEQIESMALGIVTPQELRKEIKLCLNCRDDENKGFDHPTSHNSSNGSETIETDPDWQSEQTVNFSSKGDDENIFAAQADERETVEI